MADKKQPDPAVELLECCKRLRIAVENLHATGLRRELLVHAIHSEANRGFPRTSDKIGKRQIERVLDALEDPEALLFEPEEEVAGG